MRRAIAATVAIAVLGGAGLAIHDLVTRPPQEQVQKMHRAVLDGDVDAMNRLLAESPRLARATYKQPMLVTAACTYSPIPHQTEVCRILLAHGADPNASNGQPLHGAVYCANTDLVRLLLKHGADPHLKGGRSERSPYEHAKWRELTDVVKLFDEPRTSSAAGSR